MGLSQKFKIFTIVLVINNFQIDGFEGTVKVCKTTQDCTNPELSEFCDQILGVCWLCRDYCTGSEELKPNCAQHCPLLYAEVYHQRDTSPTTPTFPPSPNIHRENNNSSSSSNNNSDSPPDNGEASSWSKVDTNVLLISIVGSVVMVALLAAVLFGLKYLRKKHKKTPDLLDPEKPPLEVTTYQCHPSEEVPTEHEKLEEEPSEENKIDKDSEKDEESEPENEVVQTIGQQADPPRCSPVPYALPKDKPKGNSSEQGPSSVLNFA